MTDIKKTELANILAALCQCEEIENKEEGCLIRMESCPFIEKPCGDITPYDWIAWMNGEQITNSIIPKPTPFGNRLREWRLRNNMTFSELSRLVGLSPGTLSEIEIGRREPTDEQRKLIQDIIKTSR